MAEGAVDRPRSRRLAIFVLIFASFMDLVDTTIVNVALPSIRADLGAGPAQLEWVVSAYMLAFAVLLITGGRLGDIFGRQRIFVLGVAGFTLCSLAAAVAPGPVALIAARAGQGAFAAMMAPQLLSSIQVLFEPEERAPVFGVVGAMSGLAAVVGPVLGGWLVTADVLHLAWRSVFLINVPIGLVLVLAALRYVPDTVTSDRPRLDVPGIALASTGLLLLFFPLVEGRDQGWPVWIWMMLGAAIVVLGYFARYEVIRERRDSSSLLPMHLFHNRGFSSGSVIQSIFQGSTTGFFLTLTIYTQIGLGYSAVRAGLVLLSYSIGAILGTGASVPLTAKFGKAVMCFGAALQAVALWWTVQVIRGHGGGLTIWNLAPSLAVAGVGLGLLVVPLVNVALATIEQVHSGAASGALGTFQQCGSALGVALTGVVFFHVAGAEFTVQRLEQAISSAAWVPIAGFAICALAVLLLPGRKDVEADAESRGAMANG